jgi:peptidyl-prolyl cis-trans isomerase D
MLGSIRKRTNSWLVRGMLLLLAASFALWGVGDIFRGGQEPSVARVGDIEVSASRFSAEFRQEIDRLQLQSGQNFTTEQAIAAGLHFEVLGRLVRDALIEQEAARLGLVVPDEAIQQDLMETAAFRNEQGRFDPLIYRTVLNRNGFKPKQYEALLRKEKTILALQNTVIHAPPPPDAWIDALFEHRNEQRRARYIMISSEAQTAEREPDEAELSAFHLDNAMFYTAPEYREVTYVKLDPTSLEDEIEISLDDLFYEYEARGGEYATPERRRVEQILARDKAAADAVLIALQSGASFAEAAEQTHDLGTSHLELGSVARAELFPEIAPTIFSLSEGGVSRPLETGLGWHFFWVREVVAASTKSFDEVKDVLRTELVREMARDGLYQFTNRIEDALAGGATLEEAADGLGLDTQHIPSLSSGGNDEARTPVEGLPTIGSFIDVAFGTEPGHESSPIEDAEGNYLILRVDAITPAALRSLDEVRDLVIRGWKSVERSKGAEQIAADAAERISTGASIEALADELGATIHTSAALARDGRDAELGAVLDGLFALAPDSAAAVFGRTVGGFVVAVLDGIEAADSSADPEGLRPLRDELASGLANELLLEYQAALEARYPISVEIDTINSMF